ncbi:Crinkler (CRN) [Phytophthora megakarya]|uniref:Crinkler (CRN) n=1 Tax=Phytophthora megakarya TaxID=4795 RepID=A0A225VW55_9STRA|nr:Crinkler (CRN) [Phytophthora megakarya]
MIVLVHTCTKSTCWKGFHGLQVYGTPERSVPNGIQRSELEFDRDVRISSPDVCTTAIVLDRTSTHVYLMTNLHIWLKKDSFIDHFSDNFKKQTVDENTRRVIYKQCRRCSVFTGGAKSIRANIKWRNDRRSSKLVTELISKNKAIEHKYKHVYVMYDGYMKSMEKKKVITGLKRKRGEI